MGDARAGRLAGATVTLVALGALPCLAPAAAVSTTAPRWLTWNGPARLATLTLIAGYSAANDDFNFDGYSKGAMVVSIPADYHVVVVFSNRGPYPHSAVITPFTRKNSQGVFPVAFPGSSTPDALDGYVGRKIERFRFVAARPGVYAIVCGVAGHEGAGMWDVLRVAGGGTPSLTTR